MKGVAYMKITDNTISKPSLDIENVRTPIIKSKLIRSYMAQSDTNSISISDK